PQCLVLGSGAQPGHGAVDNRERSAAVWAATLRPASAIRPAPRPAASAERPAMGLWPAEALLVGPTRPPLQVVVNGRARASCGHLRIASMAFFDRLLEQPRLERSALAEQPVSRRASPSAM